MAIRVGYEPVPALEDLAIGGGATQGRITRRRELEQMTLQREMDARRMAWQDHMARLQAELQAAEQERQQDFLTEQRKSQEVFEMAQAATGQGYALEQIKARQVEEEEAARRLTQEKAESAAQAAKELTAILSDPNMDPKTSAVAVQEWTVKNSPRLPPQVLDYIIENGGVIPQKAPTPAERFEQTTYRMPDGSGMVSWDAKGGFHWVENPELAATRGQNAQAARRNQKLLDEAKANVKSLTTGVQLAPAEYDAMVEAEHRRLQDLDAKLLGQTTGQGAASPPTPPGFAEPGFPLGPYGPPGTALSPEARGTYVVPQPNAPYGAPIPGPAPAAAPGVPVGPPVAPPVGPKEREARVPTDPEMAKIMRVLKEKYPDRYAEALKLAQNGDPAAVAAFQAAGIDLATGETASETKTRGIATYGPWMFHP